MSTKNLFVRIALKDAMTAQMKNVNSSLNKTKQNAKGLNKSIGGASMAFAGLAGQAGVAAAAFATLFVAFQQVRTGLQFVEDFKQSVITMSGFVATFSKKGQMGDYVNAFKEANDYAKELIPKLEIMDAKTIASGRDLSLMAETMAQYGVWLDLSNKKQEEGFINMANALAMMTAGQQKEIQMRQEIHALMAGQMRMTDRLPKVLNSIWKRNKDTTLSLREQIDLWNQQGVTVEKVGEMLSGFGEAVPEIENTWSAVGTTMQTIYRRIMRGGMLTAYDDLIRLAQKFNRSLMDADGNLGPLGQKVVDMLNAGWGEMTSAFQAIKPTVTLFKNLLGDVMAVMSKVTQMTGASALEWGIIGGALLVGGPQAAALTAALVAINKGLKEYGMNIGAVAEKANNFGDSMSNLWGALSGDLDKNTGAVITPIQKIRNEIALLVAEVEAAESDKWYLFSFFDDQSRVSRVEAYKQKINELIDEISRLERTEGVDKALLDFFDFGTNTPEGGVNIDSYKKFLDEREKLTAKYATSEQRLSGRLRDEMAKQTISLMEDGVDKEIAQEKSKWDSLRESQLDGLEALAKDRAKIYREEIISSNKKAYNSYFDKLGEGQVEELNQFKKLLEMQVKDGVITKRQGSIAIAKFEERQRREADRQETAFLVKRVQESEEFAGKRQEIIAAIVDAEKRGTDQILAKDRAARAEQTTNMTKMLNEAYAEVANMALDDDGRKRAGIVEQYGEAFEYLAFAIETATSQENIDKLKSLREAMGEEMVNKLREVGEEADKTFNEKFNDAVKGWASGFSESLNDMLWSAEATFSDIVRSFAKMITQMVIQEKLVKSVFKFMGFANGGVFSGGDVTAFASGGVVSSPTLFPMNSGVGLMAEAGPEAIMPLKRGSDGKLGVEASGGQSSVNINLSVSAPDSQTMRQALVQNKTLVVNMVQSAFHSKGRSFP